MALWESLTLLIAARLWLVRFPLGTVVRVRSDNISALYMVLKCKAKSPALSIVAREIAMDQARSLYEFTLLKHINTKDNLIADALSRQFEPIPAPFPELGNCVRNPVQVEFRFLASTEVKGGVFSGDESLLGVCLPCPLFSQVP